LEAANATIAITMTATIMIAMTHQSISHLQDLTR
jgi:hypothetical protein